MQRGNQGYGNANAVPPHMSRYGRVIIPTPRMTQDVRLSQLDPTMMGSQREYIEQHYYPGEIPQHSQGLPVQAQQFQQRLPAQQTGSQYPGQVALWHQPQQQQQQRHHVVYERDVQQQLHEQQHFQQQLKQQQQLQQQQQQLYQPQFPPPARQRADQQQERRVAPRIEGPPPGHQYWANEQGMPPEVLARSYRQLQGGQSYLPAHLPALPVVVALPGGGYGIDPIGPQFQDNPLGENGLQQQPYYNEQERGAPPGQGFIYQNLPQQYFPQENTHPSALPPTRRRLEGDALYGYGPNNTQLEYPEGDGYAPPGSWVDHSSSRYNDGGIPAPRVSPFRLPPQQQHLWGPGQGGQQHQQMQPERQHEDEGFEEPPSQRNVRKVRVAPPISEQVSSRLAAHTTHAEELHPPRDR